VGDVRCLCKHLFVICYFTIFVIISIIVIIVIVLVFSCIYIVVINHGFGLFC